jgi:hypothetical protein
MSVNSSRIDMNEYPEIFYGWCGSRIIRFIVSLRLENPGKRILRLPVQRCLSTNGPLSQDSSPFDRCPSGCGLHCHSLDLWRITKPTFMVPLLRNGGRPCKRDCVLRRLRPKPQTRMHVKEMIESHCIWIDFLCFLARLFRLFSGLPGFSSFLCLSLGLT